MAIVPKQFLLRVHGVLYSVEVESESADLDWLDRVILDVAASPQNVSDFIRCFGLPRRLIEDAISKLIERHLLLLDVARAQVRTSGIDPSSTSAYRPRTTILVWQDHVTGIIVPWERIEALCKVPERAEPVDVQDLKGRPPSRTVLEMSDAELLTRIERFRPDSAWSEIIVQRERVRPKIMWITAQKRDNSGVVIIDDVPNVLVRSWGRFMDIGTADMPTRQYVELPRSWRDIAGDWLQSVNSRIDGLMHPADHLLDENSLALLHMREAIERYWRLEIIEDGSAFARQRAQPQGEVRNDVRLVVATSQAGSGYGDAISILRQTRAAERFLLESAHALKSHHEEGVRAAGGTFIQIDRNDVEFIFINNTELVAGGVSHGRHCALRLLSARPLLALATWPSGISEGTRTFARLQNNDNPGKRDLLQDIVALDQSLHALTTGADLPATSSPGLTSEMTKRLRHDLDQLEPRLMHHNLTPGSVLGSEDVLAVLQEQRGGRLLVRDEASPLVRAATNHEVIVCSMMEPKTSVYWIKESIPAEIVILGDVVIFGWWSYDGPGELPPFFACHAPVVATNLRARTDHVVAR